MKTRLKIPHSLSSRFATLPEGVTLTPRSLHIEFQGREEPLERLGTVVFALEKGTERILRFVETEPAGQ